MCEKNFIIINLNSKNNNNNNNKLAYFIYY